LGLDDPAADFLAHLHRSKSPRQKYNILQDMIDHDFEFLDRSHHFGGPSVSHIPLALRKMEIEKAYLAWNEIRRASVTGLRAVKSLYDDVCKLSEPKRCKLFKYYGAEEDLHNLQVPLSSNTAARLLTACIVGAQRTKRGKDMFLQDKELVQAVLRALKPRLSRKAKREKQKRLERLESERDKRRRRLLREAKGARTAGSPHQ
jgi:hypothetical protein